MKFNVSNFHTIFEAADENKKVNNKEINDETGANIDNTLGDNDLLSIFDDICPITGDVYASMKNAASDPKNLKITAVKDGSGEDAKLFVEAMEFATFCEAANMNPGEAAEEIKDTYKEEIPGIENSEIHVVFPSESLNKNTLGGEKLGRATQDEWAVQLMRGCRRYGLKVNSSVDSVDESKNDSLNEAAQFDNRVKEYFPSNDALKVVAEINSASKLSYITFKNNFTSSWKESNDNEYKSHKLKDLDQFYNSNKSYPKFKSFRTDSDIPAAILDIKGNNDDFVLFYQDEVAKNLNKSDKFKALGYKASTEDYPGIYIYKRGK